MAFKNFPKDLYVTKSLTGMVNGLGKITSSTEFTLETIRTVLYAQEISSAGGSETLQMKLYSDEAMTIEYAASNVLNLVDLVSGTTNWIGYIDFTFETLPNINTHTVCCGLVVSNYTNTDTFFLAVPFDWPLNINASTVPEERGGWIELYGYQDGI